jgi:hypothetical protein
LSLPVGKIHFSLSLWQLFTAWNKAPTLLDDYISKRVFLGPPERHFQGCKAGEKLEKIYICFKGEEEEFTISSFVKETL